MSKWSNLVGGNASNVSEKTYGLTTFITVAVLAILIIGVVIALSGSHGKAKKSVKKVQQPEVLPVLTIVQEKIATTAEPSDEVVQPIEASQDAVVMPKKSITNRFFDFTNEPQPMENEHVTYEAYDKVFQSERQTLKFDKPYVVNNDTFTSLREKINGSGMSVQEYIEKYNIQIEDNLYEALVQNETIVNVHEQGTMNFNTLDSETMLLSREASQPVPLQGPMEILVQTLQDILSARMEASKQDIQLPEVSQEQQQALQYWATANKGMASELAKTILSRV
jgi:hypothetical protein